MSFNPDIAYIAMYRALDCRQEETKNEELREYLGDINPYFSLIENQLILLTMQNTLSG